MLTGCGGGTPDTPDDSGGGDSIVDTDSAQDTDTSGDSDTDTAEPPTDADGDGQTTDEGDCSDHDAATYRGAPDVQGDGIDSNCDGIDSERFLLAESSASARLFGDMGDGGYGNTAGWKVVMSADATGDGLPDVYASGPVEYFDETLPSPQEAVWLVPGGTLESGHLTATADSRWGEDAIIQFGEGIDDTSDIDGDGYGDVIIGAAGDDGGRGFGAVYLGGSRHDGAMADYYFAVGGREQYDWLGALVVADVDSDGDGLQDVAMNNAATTLMFQSPISGLATVDDADVVLGAIVYPLAGRDQDLDRDGYDDVLLYNSSDSSRISIAAGPFSGEAVPPSLFDVLVPEGGNYSFSIGDLNGDSQIDLAFGVAGFDSAGTNSGRVGFFLGPLSGEVDFSDAVAFLDAEHSQVGLSNGLSIAGDLDGDGDDEIVVGAPGVYANQTGAVVIFTDLWEGTTTTAQADIVLDGADLEGRFGWSLATDGDLDGDGLDDLVVGAPYDQAASGSVWLIPSKALADWWR